jgi:uncharacterized protein DUF6518
MVVAILIGAAAFGAIDQYLATQYSPFLIEVSGLSAPWLLLPFLAGASQPATRPAALLGLAATWLAVAGYSLLADSPMETLARQWPWLVGGLITGPLYGWLGHRFRARRSWTVGLLAALPVLLEPFGRWLTTHFGLDRLARWQFSWPPSGLGQGAVTAMLAEACLGLLLLAATAAFAQRRTAGVLRPSSRDARRMARPLPAAGCCRPPGLPSRWSPT